MESVGGEICGVRDWLPHDRLIRDNDCGAGLKCKDGQVFHLGYGVANCDFKVHARQASRKNQLDLCRLGITGR